MRASGTRWVVRTDEAPKSGSMARSMKDTGAPIKPMVEADLFTLTVTCIMENGKMTKPMVTANIIIQTELGTKVTGLKMHNTAKAKRYGLTMLLTKEAIAMARSTATANSCGLTIQHTLVNLLRTTSMVKVFTPGPMAADSKAPGKTTRWTASELSHGQMADHMWEAI